MLRSPTLRCHGAAYAVILTIFCVSLYLFFSRDSYASPPPSLFDDNIFPTDAELEADLIDPVPCIGPRGKLLSESPDDQLHAADLPVCECLQDMLSTDCFSNCIM